MAGLSTVGGWFGGNAMLGSAILNGISIGVTGGGAAFATLPVIAKAGVMTSITASALDGVAAFQKPDTKNISYQVRLTVPNELGSKAVRQITKQLNDIESKLVKAGTDNDEDLYIELMKEKNALLKDAVATAQSALKNGDSNEDLMVLSVLSKKAGRSDLFEKLLRKTSVEEMANTGYLDYLKAVVSIERGDINSATNLLWKSWRLNPYAIEQPLLLINILGSKKFADHEEEILTIAQKAKKDFDTDKYEPGYSLVSLNYRLATMYLINKKYQLAQDYYKHALDELSLLQKHFGKKSIKHTISLGIANSLYGANKKAEAQEQFEKILADVKTDEEKAFFRSQYAGTI